MGIFNLLKKQLFIGKSLEEKFRFLKRNKYEPLGRVLTEEEVEEFEISNGITLPDDYKWFLKNIGNGIDFPIPKPIFSFSDNRVVKGIDNATFDVFYDDKILLICDAGCTYQYFLVLTGNHCGEVWLCNDHHDFSPIKQSFCEFLKWVVKAKCI